MSRVILASAVVLAAAAATSGCAGSRVQVMANADRLHGPVSLSATVPGPSGEILGSQDLEVVGQFSKEKTYRSIAWGFLLPWRTWDTTDDFNEAMARHGGEAITSVSVSTESMSGGTVMKAFAAILIPILPTSITVRVRGTVVRRRFGARPGKPIAGCRASCSGGFGAR